MRLVSLTTVFSVIIFGLVFFRHYGESELSAENQWGQFKAVHNKTYDSIEEPFRFDVFKANLKRIKNYQDNDKGASYGVTKFADLTPKEFKTQILGVRGRYDSLNPSHEGRQVYKPRNQDIPAAFDWRNKSAVTPVKNQGSCGSCWAFSAIQNIEGAHAIKHGELLTLSEQELVDCDKVDLGCDGGLMENAMTFLQNNGGVALESDYPYTGEDGTCNFDKSKAAVQVTGYLNISSNETEIAQSLVELGPLSIAVHADPWQFYLGGITNPWFCNGDLDHGVLLVGYGRGSSFLVAETDYWIIKNSWGESWGESGYIRLVRGSGVCGMNKDVISATVA